MFSQRNNPYCELLSKHRYFQPRVSNTMPIPFAAILFKAQKSSRQTLRELFCVSRNETF